jgi:hypothetical protein
MTTTNPHVLTFRSLAMIDIKRLDFSETLSKDGPVNPPSLDADMMLRILDLASDIACWSHTFAHDCRFNDSAMGTHIPADAQKV